MTNLSTCAPATGSVGTYGCTLALPELCYLLALTHSHNGTAQQRACVLSLLPLASPRAAPALTATQQGSAVARCTAHLRCSAWGCSLRGRREPLRRHRGARYIHCASCHGSGRPPRSRPLARGNRPPILIGASCSCASAPRQCRRASGDEGFLAAGHFSTGACWCAETVAGCAVSRACCSIPRVRTSSPALPTHHWFWRMVRWCLRPTGFRSGRGRFLSR